MTRHSATRRSILMGLGSCALPGGAGAGVDETARGRLAAIEADLGGRLGVCASRLDGSRSLGHRQDERFKMCSTFKLLLAGAVLSKVDAGRERLDRRIAYSKADLLDYAPTTAAHVGEGAMSVANLCRAAVTLSDNTAANLLLTSLGGPPALTDFVRGMGDRITRLDRKEPMLNTGVGADVRDTTSPLAMMNDLKSLAFGRALSPASRAQLTAWLIATQTGDHRLRAGVPASARVGDKTGTWNADGTGNDVAIVWPKGGAPILIAAYATGSGAAPDKVDLALAEVGRVAYRALA